MPESGNYFAWLGLAPGSYSPQELASRLDEFRRFERDESRLADATMAFCLLRDPDRQADLLRSLSGGSTAGADSQSPPLEPNDPHVESAFTAAVAVLLEGDSGVLRYSNRRRLLSLAARLGIVPFEANLLIERARFKATQRPGWVKPAGSQQTGRPIRRLRRWLIVIAIAVVVDAVAMAYVLR